MKGTSWNITEKEVLETVTKEILEEVGGMTKGCATVLALHGDLGAGKTTFVQTLAKELGVKDTVTSPTFVIMKRYSTSNTRWPFLIHIDAYRLNDTEELQVLGLERDLSQSGNLFCIEWAEKVADLLPLNTVHLHFGMEGEKRTLRLVANEE